MTRLDRRWRRWRRRGSLAYDLFFLFSKFLKLTGLIFISANLIECSWPFQWNQLIPCGKTESHIMRRRLQEWGAAQGASTWGYSCQRWRPQNTAWLTVSTIKSYVFGVWSHFVTNESRKWKSLPTRSFRAGTDTALTLLWLLSPYFPMRLTRWQFLYQKAPL